jgi:hypothetical protein
MYEKDVIACSMRREPQIASSHRTVHSQNMHNMKPPHNQDELLIAPSGAQKGWKWNKIHTFMIKIRHDNPWGQAVRQRKGGSIIQQPDTHTVIVDTT